VTPAARLIAVVAGLVGLLFAAAGTVREVVLAAHGTTDWPLSTWWARVTGEPSAATTVAAVLAGLLAVVFLLLAVRQLGGQRRGPALVEWAGEHGWARLDVGALEHALRRRLEVEIPGIRAHALDLSKRTGGWQARLEAELPARDLDALQARAHGLLAADLTRTAGMTLEALDIVALRLTTPPAGSA
jgi:hypothetical protein